MDRVLQIIDRFGLLFVGDSKMSAVTDLGVIAIEHAKMHEVLHEKYETLRTDASGWYRFLALS